jgi:hypothetical protein
MARSAARPSTGRYRSPFRASRFRGWPKVIGLTGLRGAGEAGEPPKLNRNRALLVIGKIDEILEWERTTNQERDARFVELGRYLCEVRAKQHYRIDGLHTFDEFLAKRFPASRRKAYYLMAIHEQLPRQLHASLNQVGWTKATDLAKVARKDGADFDSAFWLHKAQELPKEQFKREVQRHVTGREREPTDILYFTVRKNQREVIEQALELAGRMIGPNRSRSYCLEMLCADFVAGAKNEGEPEIAVQALAQMYSLLPEPQRAKFDELVPRRP